MIFFVEQGGELIRYWEDICISGWTAYKVKKYISQTFREASKERRAIYQIGKTKIKCVCTSVIQGPIFLHLQTSWPTVRIHILTSTTGSYRDRLCPERGGLRLSCFTAYNWVKKSIHFSQKTESSNCGLRLHSSIQRYCNKTGMLISIRILCLLLHQIGRAHV